MRWSSLVAVVAPVAIGLTGWQRAASGWPAPSQVVPAARELIAKFRQRDISFATLVDVLAFQLPLTIDAKLQILAELDVATRAHILLDGLSQVASPKEGPERPGADFSPN